MATSRLVSKGPVSCHCHVTPGFGSQIGLPLFVTTALLAAGTPAEGLAPALLGCAGIGALALLGIGALLGVGTLRGFGTALDADALLGCGTLLGVTGATPRALAAAPAAPLAAAVITLAAASTYFVDTGTAAVAATPLAEGPRPAGLLSTLSGAQPSAVSTGTTRPTIQYVRGIIMSSGVRRRPHSRGCVSNPGIAQQTPSAA
jgi:hypothetical protein